MVLRGFQKPYILWRVGKPLKNRRFARKKVEKFVKNTCFFRAVGVLYTGTRMRSGRILPICRRGRLQRYALKREVATENGRFFRGVCPISNRANKESCKWTCETRRSAPSRCKELRGSGEQNTQDDRFAPENKLCIPVFFGKTEETPGRVCRIGVARQLKIFKEAFSKWQSKKKSVSV